MGCTRMRSVHPDPYQAWCWFTLYIRRVRRFIPPESMDPRKWLRGIRRRKGKLLRPGDLVWRARTFDPPPPGPLDQGAMGAPPLCDTPCAGRANARGIQVFYCAEDEGTAVAEVRRRTAADVWVAKWTPARQLRLLDLTPDARHRSAALTGYYRELSRAFAKPVGSEDPELEYLPTQYVAEVVREAGFDGLRYESFKQPHGRNIAIFCQLNRLTMVDRPYCVRVEAVGSDSPPERRPTPPTAEPFEWIVLWAIYQEANQRAREAVAWPELERRLGELARSVLPGLIGRGYVLAATHEGDPCTGHARSVQITDEGEAALAAPDPAGSRLLVDLHRRSRGGWRGLPGEC